MVLFWDREPEQPSLSIILPRLYLGAESDVTQECLSSLGISYVLSVSRCSPQPSFLPRTRYLRIPIDDSLWDDLLPWIPQALHFIDTAVSSGASVLVHCAAGISRSPALAVAYVMYRLGMDLDHAYRFVKERRPSISPNFNFLGQLQHLQGALSQKGNDVIIQPLKLLDARPLSRDSSISHAPSSHSVGVTGDPAESEYAHRENFYQADAAEPTHSFSEPQPLTLSGKLRPLNLTVSQMQQEVQALPLSFCQPDQAAPQPAEPQLPAGSASQFEKRRSLTLSLPPLRSSCPPNRTSSSQQTRSAAISQNVHKRETGVKPEAETKSSRPPAEGAAERDQGLLSPLASPLGLTLTKLLDWGERVLLGGALLQPIRMGRPTLPYRC
ncbi:hypothetical protein LDENG_00272910 [Lucifuga dentata]|nr:hypothetical protein LDENG_00272910 [Lucifuga dentata]